MRIAVNSHRFVFFIVICLVTNVFANAQSAPSVRTPEPIPPMSSNHPEDSNNTRSPVIIDTAEASDAGGAYRPITPRQRLRWFITNTIGPPHMAGGLFTAGFGTALDRPQEYGTHWGGFGERYGMRMTGIVTSNAIEASAGLLFREDPRYFRMQDQPF